MGHVVHRYNLLLTYKEQDFIWDGTSLSIRIYNKGNVDQMSSSTVVTLALRVKGECKGDELRWEILKTMRRMRTRYGMTKGFFGGVEVNASNFTVDIIYYVTLGLSCFNACGCYVLMSVI